MSGRLADQLYYTKGKATSLWVMGYSLVPNDPNKALSYGQKALAIAEKIDDGKLLWDCLTLVGNVKFALKDIQGCEDVYARSMQVARQLQDRNLLLKALFNNSIFHSSCANFAKAIEQIQEAIVLANELGDKGWLAKLHVRMGGILCRQSNYPAALESYLAALRINEQLDDKPAMMTNLNNLAGVYSDQYDFDSVLKIAQKALLLSKQMDDSLRIAICYANIGNIYLKVNNPGALKNFQNALVILKNDKSDLKLNVLTNIGAIFTSRKDFDKAQKYFGEALALADNFKTGMTKIEVDIRMGEFYFAKKQYKLAIDYACRALSMARGLNYLEIQRDCNKLLADVYAITKDYNKAYQNHVLYKSLSDSLFNEKNIRKMAILESSYQYDKDRQRHEMEAASQQLEIKGQKQLIVFLVITSLLVLLLAVAIYWWNKLKKKVLKLEIESINHELESNQKAMTSATLKLVQNAERDANSVKMLENIKKNTVEEVQKEVRTLIADYKFKSYNANWDEFELLFQKVNTSFYTTLNERFPTLTPNERKLCVFLKLNMSNSHISQVTFQSEEALKKARLRLRKKLNLDRDTNLSVFIQGL